MSRPIEDLIVERYLSIFGELPPAFDDPTAQFLLKDQWLTGLAKGYVMAVVYTADQDTQMVGVCRFVGGNHLKFKKLS